ncbi:uncharacterized protein IUM83_04468 [Phytophthora cinnamomi]|uniref:uncharacterized protein n=1 Tax=Phytophthora cinnamomi TaxID=4785 RepID=UPI003559DBD4|nr:putative membrane protein [Phytophthora cinnamomi]
MARAEDQRQRTSDDSESDDNSSGYDSDSTGDDNDSDGSDYGSEVEADGESDDLEEAAAQQQRVRADVDEMRSMMADMDAVRARLQLRFAAERQARKDRIARMDREREVQDAARRRAEEEARARQVEAAVQTDAIAAGGGVSQQQTQMSQSGSGPPHLAADDAAGRGRSLSAVDGVEGFADDAPNKAKPAGLSLYDLVKASGIGPSRKVRSSVRQADPPVALSPAHASNEHELAATERKGHVHEQGPGPDAKREWDGVDSQLNHDRDSVLENDSGRQSRHHPANIDSMRSHLLLSKGGHSLQFPPRSDENSPSVSNSLVSSGAGSDCRSQSAVLSDLTQRRDHRFNAAALLSASKRVPGSPAVDDDDKGKTDEQREMEAIQFLLFSGGCR